MLRGGLVDQQSKKSASNPPRLFDKSDSATPAAIRRPWVAGEATSLPRLSCQTSTCISELPKNPDFWVVGSIKPTVRPKMVGTPMGNSLHSRGQFFSGAT